MAQINPKEQMFKVSDILTTPPTEFSTPLQKKVYESFTTLGIPFGRVDTDPGITMEDCQHIDAKIGVRIVKAVAESEWFACTDGTPTCFVKLRTADLLNKYIPNTNHHLTIIVS